MGPARLPRARGGRESNYSNEIRALFGRSFDPDGTENTTQAHLIPEPTNKYDPNAVKVVCSGNCVGYLPKEDAARYAPVLTQPINQGWTPQVQADVSGMKRPDWDNSRRNRFVCSVRVDLAELHMIVPTNMPPPELHTVLPTSRFVQVTGEEKHMAHLASLVEPSERVMGLRHPARG